MSDKLREALEAAREFAAGWQYAGKQWDEAQDVVRLVAEALAADDAARGTMREQFEAHMRTVWTPGYDFPKTPDGEYVHGELQRFWLVWQASRAAAPQSVEPVAEVIDWPNDQDPVGVILLVEKSTLPVGAKLYLHPAPTEADRLDAEADAVRFRWLAAHPDWHFIEFLCRQFVADNAAEFLSELRRVIDARRSVELGAFEQHATMSARPSRTEGDRLDAQRYRWLREGCNSKTSEATHIAANCWGLVWDVAIDAAMSAQAGGKGHGS